jgi:hypothetical protein
MEIVIKASVYDEFPSTETVIGSTKWVHVNQTHMSMMSFMQYVANRLNLVIVRFDGNNAICK